MKFRMLTVFLIALCMVLAACNSGSPSSSSNGSAGAKESDQSSEEKKESAIDGTMTGVVQWAAGGAADTISRAIAPLAEKELGQSIVMTNKPGATGAIALQHVLDQKPDGKTLLFAAENPALYGVLDISKSDFEDLYPINIFSAAQTAIIVPKDSKYDTMADLVEDAKANPGKVKMGSTGPGGQPFVVATMLSSVVGAEFNLVPYDGDGPLVSAILGNHLDASAVGLTAAIENAKAGKIKVLAITDTDRVDDLPDVPAITDDVPEMEKFLPWGPFYGVWVRNDTPDEIKAELTEAFKTAQAAPEFQDFLKQTDGVSLGLSGDEAIQYWKDWQSKTAWILHDAGESKVDPATLNIEKKE
ncbi:tripartite tricarboxylate transporter substrate binding protein [Sporosarcina sp. FSL W7-1349]|uniref:tripartite tricarboxylate transporter substrate binding protein n=1 Tax=Sporosarcina sp. FSL W7-1349 TaxID=2921561 RepID=UPI0030FC3312